MAHSSISPAQLNAAAETFDLLSTPSRLHIVLHLLDGPLDVSTIAAHTGATVPATSQQLAKLRTAGVVRATRDGRHQVYEVDDEHIVGILSQVMSHINPDGATNAAPVDA